EVEETFLTLKEYGFERKEEMIDYAQDVIRSYNQRIDKVEESVESKANELSSTVKETLNQNIQKVKSLRDSLSMTVAKVKPASEKTYIELKGEVQKGEKMLRQSLENLEEEYLKNSKKE
ncbi:MAG: hypothetical protein C0594_14185, partial [Marinilabiliales bacterium]